MNPWTTNEKSKSYIHVCIQKGSGITTQEVWETGNPCKQQTRETEAPWTVTSFCDSWNIVLKLDNLGIQPSKQGRQELPGLLVQSMIFKIYY